MRIRAKRVSNILKLLSLACAGSIAISLPASAQGLRDNISYLFIL
jgi:hypothetical protein